MLWYTVKKFVCQSKQIWTKHPRVSISLPIQCWFLPCIPYTYYAESSSSCLSRGVESERVQKSHQALGWWSSQSPFHSSVMYRKAKRYEDTHWWTVFAQTHYWISAIFTWHFGPLLPVWHLRARSTCLWRADHIMVHPPARLVYSWGATNIEGSNSYCRLSIHTINAEHKGLSSITLAALVACANTWNESEYKH